jgi:hypothetical protein
MAQIRDLLITLLLFSGIIIGISTFMSDLAKKYSTNIEDLSQLSSIQKIEEETANLEQTLRNTQITGTFLDIPITILSGVYSIFKLMLVSFVEIWTGFLNSIAIYLFLPKWFISIVVGLVVIFIMFEIISAVMKYRV